MVILAGEKQGTENRELEEGSVRGMLIVSGLCLAAGLGLIFAFCRGTTGFSFAYPVSGSSLHLDITTTGAPALGGVALTVIGAVLLVIAWVLALSVRSRKNTEGLKRREEPFTE